jgi:hypothetical protein
MALSVVQHKFVKQGTGTPSSLSVTVTATGAGNLLVAQVVSADSSAKPPTSVTDGTTNFTQFPSARVTWTGTFNGVVTDCYYLASSASGKTSITSNYGTGVSFLEIEVWEVSGFTTVATDGTVNNGTGGSTGVSNLNTGPQITTTGSVGFIAATCGTDTGSIDQNPNSGNAFTSGGDASGDGFVSLITSASGNYTPVWHDTGATDHFTSIVCAFKESAGGGSAIVAPSTLTLMGVQ